MHVRKHGHGPCPGGESPGASTPLGQSAHHPRRLWAPLDATKSMLSFMGAKNFAQSVIPPARTCRKVNAALLEFEDEIVCLGGNYSALVEEGAVHVGGDELDVSCHDDASLRVQAPRQPCGRGAQPVEKRTPMKPDASTTHQKSPKPLPSTYFWGLAKGAGRRHKLLGVGERGDVGNMPSGRMRRVGITGSGRKIMPMMGSSGGSMPIAHPASMKSVVYAPTYPRPLVHSCDHQRGRSILALTSPSPTTKTKPPCPTTHTAASM